MLIGRAESCDDNAIFGSMTYWPLYSLVMISAHMTCLCRSLTMRRVPLQSPFLGLMFRNRSIVAPTCIVDKEKHERVIRGLGYVEV